MSSNVLSSEKRVQVLREINAHAQFIRKNLFSFYNQIVQPNCHIVVDYSCTENFDGVHT